MNQDLEVNAIIVLENFSSHRVDKSQLPQNILIKLLLPNVTGTNHTVDMVIISSFKVGYKSLIFRNLLGIFNYEGGF